MSRIRTMQHGLASALQRASLADDRELAGRVREEGHRFVFLLNGVVRTSRLYDAGNAALSGPAAEAAAALRGLVELLGAVHVVCVEEHVYVNDVRLRVRPSEQPVIDAFVAELARHNVGGISFHASQPPEGLRALAVALASPPAGAERARSALAARLAHLSDVELTGRYRFRVKGERPAVRRSLVEAMERGAAVAAEAVANLGAHRLPNPLPVRRAVIDLVHAVREDAPRAAAASLRRRPPGAGDHHLLAVTNLALLLGEALGLDDAALSDLGVAGMLHDVGYASSGREGHEVAGFRTLLRQRGFHEGKVRRLLATLEHHRAFEGELPSLFARILKIVDDYEVLTRTGAQGPPGLPPPTAQGAMWAARGTAYDPDLLALFVQLMGAYPPGSLLELSDGRWAVSVSGGRDPDHFAWPVVRVVRQADGSQAGGEAPLDLSLGRDLVRPRRVLNP
ncbi:MAG TPA: HD domain-containing protein, partial [Vicinamibacteria bacterium]